MKKIVNRIGSSSHVQFVIFGIILLLGTLALVATSATSAQNGDAREDKPVVGQNQKPDTDEAADEKFQPMRIVAEGISDALNTGEVNQAGRVPEVPTANALINRNLSYTFRHWLRFTTG